MNARDLESYDFKKLFAKKGYLYFTNGAYNLNIIGIRSKGTSVTNLFDDYLVVTYKTNTGLDRRYVFEITTDPGKYYMLNPINKNGTAILVPGQYIGAFKLGLHNKKYKALVQHKPLKVYRDTNRDLKYDYTNIQEGIFGINIHKAGNYSKFVNNWSAGCQVFSRSDDFAKFIRLCDEQVKCGHGETFTYTLLKEEELYE